MSIKLEFRVLINKLRNWLDYPRDDEVIYTDDEDNDYVQ